jgi:cell division protein FtsL
MRKKTLKFTKGEKFLFSSCILLVISIVLIQVFCGAMEGNLNLDVERLKYEINNQEKKNESLTMQMSELTSYDKIKDIVKGMGLTYKYENIVVVNK